MKRTPKYFYLCTNLAPGEWLERDGCLLWWLPWKDQPAANYIGTAYWPFTRAEARLRPGCTTMQFENKPPYKFVKIVR